MRTKFIAMLANRHLGLGFLLLLVSAGCHKEAGPLNQETFLETGNPILSGVEFVVLDGESLTFDSASIRGSGVVLATTPRRRDDNNYLFEGTLKDNGAFTLMAHADPKAKVGVRLTIERKQAELTAELKVGDESWDISPLFDSISAAGSHKYEVDVHKHGHMVIWVDGTELEDPLFFSTPIGERYWGLKLTEATLTRVGLFEAKDAH